MTREEFAKQYAKRSGVSVQRLLALGIVVTKCRCDDPKCTGWQALTMDGFQAEITMGRLTSKEIDETRQWTLAMMGASA